MLIRELPADLRPTNRLHDVGPSAMSSAELLSILVGSGTQNENALRLAETLLQRFESLHGIAKACTAEICQIHGIGPTKAAKIKAALELGLRLNMPPVATKPQIRTPNDVANILMLEMSLLEVEHLRVVLLDTKNFVSCVHTVYAGSLNAAVVRIGEIFREPVRRLAASIVIVHNHPSGDPTPSPEDVRVTEMLIEAGRLLDIQILDHIVFGRNRYVSLKERGLAFKA